MPGKRATSRVERAIMLLAALEAGTERAPSGLVDYTRNSAVVLLSCGLRVVRPGGGSEVKPIYKEQRRRPFVLSKSLILIVPSTKRQKPFALSAGPVL